MTGEPDLAQLYSALDWYRSAGVDLAVGDDPVDRFVASQAVPRPAQRAPAAAIPAAITIETDPEAGRLLAAGAATLDALKALMQDYDGCGLKQRATQICFSDGNPEARIMLIGEAPGGEEDKAGKPFVGKAGQLLDLMLASIGLDRTRVYIANLVPWRPPGNREPTPQEIAACRPFLMRQVELVLPRIVIAVGAVSMQALFGTSQGITRMRGQWRDLTLGAVPVRAMPILHPAYLLRQPAAKRQAWADMLALKRAVEQLEIQGESLPDAL